MRLAVAVALLGCSPGGGIANGEDSTSGGSSSSSTTTGSESSSSSGSTSSDASSGSTSSSSTTTGVPECPAEPRPASTLWIANTAESTVSRIDTDAMVEHARYLTRADADGDPSHASVDFRGDVAIANRNGGVVVIASDAARCPDAAATSTGPADVRPFPDGCVRWEQSFAYTRQNPVAWTRGRFDEGACEWVDVELWTSGTDGEAIDVLLLDGDSGDVVQTIAIQGLTPDADGLFAAAVDSNGDFWATQLSGELVHVARDDFEVRTHALPITSYGIAVDHDGDVWTCWQDAARFDPARETWDVYANAGGFGSCNEDRYGVLWLANDPLSGLGIATGTVLYTIDLPSYARSVAVDAENRVWAVEALTDPGVAYRIDPTTGDIATITGLAQPSMHGDPTGFALQNAGP